MRYLDHDAGAVSRLGISSFRPSMGHIFEYGQALLDNVVILAAVYVHNKSDTTSILLIFRRIQAFFKFVFHLFPMSLVTSLARPPRIISVVPLLLLFLLVRIACNLFFYGIDTIGHSCFDLLLGLIEFGRVDFGDGAVICACPVVAQADSA